MNTNTINTNTVVSKLNIRNNEMQFIFVWAIGVIIYYLVSLQSDMSPIETITPIAFCLLTVFAFNILKNYIPRFDDYKKLIAYFLFFSITISSLFGLTVTLTGSHAETTQPLLFGLSFYTTTLAYLFISKSNLKLMDAFKTANPLLIITGPIALFISNIKHRSFRNRINYYAPFLILGIFFYQIIAVPLTVTFKLLESTDLISSMLFACIFELFVYANFCGLSLIIYATFGLLGYKIPLNFRQPFSSRNVIDFWKGWHTSLSAVLKALFYTPLRSKFSSSVALLGVYIASAMWHGVTLNFLLWGSFHACIFIMSIYLLKRKMKYLSLILFIVAVIFGRLLFADSQTDRLLEKLTFSFDGFHAIFSIIEFPLVTKIALMVGFGLIAIEFLFYKSTMVYKRNYKHLRTPISQLLLIGLMIFLSMDIGVDFAVYGQR